MSSYLQRLVARTLGENSLVQPLIAPRFTSGPSLKAELEVRSQRFEPPVESHRVADAVLAAEGENHLPQSSAPAGKQDTIHEIQEFSSPRETPGPTAPESVPSQQPEPGGAQITPHETLPISEAGQVTAEARAEVSAAPIEVSAQAAKDALSGEGSAEKLATQTGLRGEQPEVSPASEQRLLVTPGIIARQVRLLPTAESPPENPVNEQRESSETLESNRTMPAPDSTLPQQGQLYEHNTLTRQAAPSLLAEKYDQPPAQPQPVIRVTIGRIEVRAVASAVASPRPRPTRSAPVLTLQEYLKRRDGGER